MQGAPVATSGFSSRAWVNTEDGMITATDLTLDVDLGGGCPHLDRCRRCSAWFTEKPEGMMALWIGKSPWKSMGLESSFISFWIWGPGPFFRGEPLSFREGTLNGKSCRKAESFLWKKSRNHPGFHIVIVDLFWRQTFFPLSLGCAWISQVHYIQYSIFAISWIFPAVREISCGNVHQQKWPQRQNNFAIYHLESRWHNSHALVYHGLWLSYLLGVASHLLSPECIWKVIQKYCFLRQTCQSHLEVLEEASSDKLPNIESMGGLV